MQIDEFEEKCLRLTIRTLGLLPCDILEGTDRLPPNQNDPLLRVARPTWMGRNYRKGGVLLLAQNPAGGAPSNRDQSHPSDAGLFEALDDIRIRRDIQSFRIWRDTAQLAAMQTWRIWRVSIAAVLDALKPIVKTEDQIAFGNLVPFRSMENKVTSMEYQRAWNADVRHVFEVLRPSLVIKMTAQFPGFTKFCRHPAVLQFRRGIGDGAITALGRADLQTIRAGATRVAAGLPLDYPAG